MDTYPGADTELHVQAEALLTTCREIFQACGMRREDASLLAETLVIADLRGVHSHGTLRVPDYVEKLLDEGVDPQGRPQIVSERAGALVVDGGNSMGQIGSAFAMRAAIVKAKETAVALAAVRGSNHCGAMAYYAMMALPENMIGIAATNALPTMAPWGGIDKILGINPVAIAIPAGVEPPIVFDAAFSASSHGKIRVYHQKGYPIPAGWAFDAAGRPTTDAAAALDGLLQPIGGYKGTGLAVIMGVLSTLLAGASFGTDLGNMVDGPRAGADGHFFLALNVAAFVEPAVFKSRVDTVVRQIRTSRPAPGLDRVYSPGEMETETQRRYRKEGIPLNAETLRGIRAMAARVGVNDRAIPEPAAGAT
jgi:LDH2 family malate/lactate/ureidoglycolate dehydrogenase